MGNISLANSSPSQHAANLADREGELRHNVAAVPTHDARMGLTSINEDDSSRSKSSSANNGSMGTMASNQAFLCDDGALQMASTATDTNSLQCGQLASSCDRTAK